MSRLIPLCLPWGLNCRNQFRLLDYQNEIVDADGTFFL